MPPPPSWARRAPSQAALRGALPGWGPRSGAAPRGPAIRVVTEELPPYNMRRAGMVTGLSTEVVRAVLQQAGIEAEIRVMPWARAYDIALNEENVLIYSIVRTPQREKLFKWVGTVAPARWLLYAQPGRGIRLERLEDARGYRVATVNQDAGEQYLLGKGFELGKSLQSSNAYEANYEKFKLGRVDLWISDELNARYLVRQAGDDPAVMLSNALPLPDLGPEGAMDMAFSRRTPDATVERFRAALRAIRQNGTYDRIQKKWL